MTAAAYVHAPSEADQIPHQHWFMKLPRGIANCIFRLLKPAVQPIAWRVRSYLIDGLRQQIQEEIQRSSAATAQELQQEIQKASAATAQDLQQEIQKASAATAQDLQQEIQKASAATAQELQREIKNASAGMAQDLQQEIQKASAATAQELQREIKNASAGMAQELQREIQNTSATSLESSKQLHGALWSRLDLIEIYGATTARRVALNCGQDEVLVKTQVGYILCAASDHALLSCLLDTGELERGTRVLIQKYLRPGDVYVDVGANVGMHTLAAARAMQGDGKIIAFEPFQPTMRMLEKSIWMNGFSSITEIHQAAVSNIIGRQKLFIGATSGHHSLFELESSPNNSKDPVEVPLVRLDGTITSGQRVDLIKIDVEGAELEVIEGGASLIKVNPDIALIVEFGPSHLRRNGHTPTQWFNAFSQLGLKYRVINNESGELEKSSLDELEKVESVNIFFAFPGSSAWGRLS